MKSPLKPKIKASTKINTPLLSPDSVGLPILYTAANINPTTPGRIPKKKLFD